jgi:hypothetical protein
MKHFDFKNKQDWQYTYNLTLRLLFATIVAVEKQYILHIVSVCVALFMQHAMSLRHSHLCPTPLYSIFFILSHKLHDFRNNKNIEHKTCIFISSTTFA